MSCAVDIALAAGFAEASVSCAAEWSENDVSYGKLPYVVPWNGVCAVVPSDVSVSCAAEWSVNGISYGKIPWNVLRGSLQTTYRSEASERRATSA